MKNASVFAQEFGLGREWQELGVVVGGAWIVGELPLEEADLRFAELGEVGALGVEAADELVEVLDCAFLPTGVGVGVVDGATEDGADLLRVNEEDVVVQQQVIDFQPISFNLLGHATQGAQEGAAAGTEDTPDIGAMVVEGEDHREEHAVAVGTRADEIGLGVSFGLAFLDGLGEVGVTVLRFVDAGRFWRDVSLSGLVASGVLNAVDLRADQALCHVTLEGAQCGDIFHFPIEGRPCGRDGAPEDELKEKDVNNQVGQLATQAFLGTVHAGVLLGNFGAVPEVLVAHLLAIAELHADDTLRTTSPKFMPQRGFCEV